MVYICPQNYHFFFRQTKYTSFLAQLLYFSHLPTCSYLWGIMPVIRDNTMNINHTKVYQLKYKFHNLIMNCHNANFTDSQVLWFSNKTFNFDLIIYYFMILCVNILPQIRNPKHISTHLDSSIKTKWTGMEMGDQTFTLSNQKFERQG